MATDVPAVERHLSMSLDDLVMENQERTNRGSYEDGDPNAPKGLSMSLQDIILEYKRAPPKRGPSCTIESDQTWPRLCWGPTRSGSWQLSSGSVDSFQTFSDPLQTFAAGQLPPAARQLPVSCRQIFTSDSEVSKTQGFGSFRLQSLK